MKEWKTYKLGDLINIQSGGTPNKAVTAYWGGNIPWISAKTMYVDFITDSDIHITEEGLKNGSKLAPVGSILLLTRGSGLFNRIPVCLVKEAVAYNQDIKCITVKDNSITSNTFIFFWLYSQKELLSGILETTGIGAGKIDSGRLLDINVTLPDIETQNKFILLCSSIFEKIEINKQINDNLEQQAEALYKSWFIDFEPFCEEEFIESSLGSIPTGWKVGELNDVCEIVGGGTPSKNHPEYYCERGIAWLTPKDLSVSKSKFSSRGSEDITPEGYKNSSTKLMPRGTVLFSSRAPIGYISIATNEICTNQGFKSAVPGIAGTGYLYYFLKANTDKIESKASGSTFKEASGALMKSLEIIIPADGILNQFEAELTPILNKQENIASEIQALTTLRDTLLPKLMSGELKINEIDC